MLFLALQLWAKETTMHDTVENGGAIHVRLHGSLFERLEDWRRAQDKIPARSDAIRKLLQRALDSEQRLGTSIHDSSIGHPEMNRVA